MGNWSVWEIKHVMIRNPAAYVSPDRVNGVESGLYFCDYIWSMCEKMDVLSRIHWAVEIYMGLYVAGGRHRQQFSSS